MSTSQPTGLEPHHADGTPSITPNTFSSHASPLPRSYTTRQGTSSDAAKISKLVGNTWSELFGWSVSPQDLDTYINVTLSPSSFESELEQSDKHIFICASSSSSSDQQAEILGVSQLVNNPSPPMEIPNSIELQRLYAHRSTHGTGLGQLLITKSKEKARELGKSKIWLGVWEGNERGKRFYEKMGFERVGEKVFYAGESKRRDLIMCIDV
ncbi:hypothetical protein L486_02416 [Kwoniella mangroviensis CBS 10435]|uniref:N-acetyltransferase domain-containing protein n=1 Tax=Kwoniella mangroviensis CBS 10435 TaxID=1331196 RepID=A0A1B9IW44_9TREE|nr:hypothetical protein L486_02416 [Kwoniella mangroviensis CBS 10435]